MRYIVRGEQSEKTLLSEIAEPPPIFYKYKQRRMQRQMKTKFSDLTMPNRILYYPTAN